MNEFKALTNLANGPIIFTYYAKSELSISTLQYGKSKIYKNVFIYKKPETSQKVRQFLWRFYIQKFRHFALRNFSLNFWNWRRGGGHSYMQKQCTLYHIVYAKNNALCVTFLYTKAWYFALHFYLQKTMHFVLRFISKVIV